MLPAQAQYVVIGAGVHGLSTAWHLAKGLKARGRDVDILVLDKKHVGAGASGIACGVVRNNYYQPAMRELMAHSVGLWESDPEGFAYHGVGYMQLAPEVMRENVVQIHEEQQAIGYPSTLVEGEEECRAYMLERFSDWQATGISVILHEHRGGYANNMASMQGLARKAEAAGVRIETGVTVTGLQRDGDAVAAVATDQGTIACDHLVVGAGPWVRDIWAMLDLPDRVPVSSPDGGSVVERPMWTFWALQEGTLEVDPSTFTDNDGNLPPVIHVDSDATLYDDMDGELVTDELWGIYYKPDFSFGGVQGGTSPTVVARPADEVAIDPYGPESPDYVVGEDFVRMWTSALAHCHKRFEGKRPVYRREPSGGIGAFTPDNFPIFDVFRQNAYVIADSNHGYKMLGIGALVAEELLGEAQPLLEPFRFSRYETGRVHPTSRSPFPWS